MGISIIVSMVVGFIDFVVGKVIVGFFKVLCSFGIDIMMSIMVGLWIIIGFMWVKIIVINVCFSFGLEINFFIVI